MDRWPSFNHFRSRKLPRSHRCLEGWRHVTLACTRRAMLAPVWEGIATQLTLLNHPHAAMFILILRVTYMRPSWLLALKKMDLVTTPASLFPCWSVVIAFCETGVSTKTRIRDGSVLMDQRWFQQLKVGNSEEKFWYFEYPEAAKIVQDGSRRFGTQRRRPDYHSLPRHSETSWKRLTNTRLGKNCLTCPVVMAP